MRWPSGKHPTLAKDRRNVNEYTGDKLAELIAKRHTCLAQLHRLGVKQAELIAAGEMSSLMRLLSAKNQLIVALQSLERQLEPFQNQQPELRQWSSPALREQCQELAEQSRRLLEGVMQMERENEQQMTLRRDRIAHQLSSLQSAETARRAYQASQQKGRSPGTSGYHATDSFTTSPGHLDIHTAP
jgi:hypothetical protein